MAGKVTKIAIQMGKHRQKSFYCAFALFALFAIGSLFLPHQAFAYTLSYYNGLGGSGAANSIGTTNIIVRNNTYIRQGYTFQYWTYARTGGIYHEHDLISITSSSWGMHAVWRENNSIVRYDTVGGTPQPPVQTGNYHYTVPAGSYKPGYKFLYWERQLVYYPGSDVDPPGGTDVTLTARYSALPYTVSYNANEGTPIPATQSGLHYYTVAAAPTRSGHTFNYWYGSNGGVYYPGSYYEFISNVTLTAQWANTYSVTYNSNGGSPTPIASSGMASYTVGNYKIEEQNAGLVYSKPWTLYAPWSVSNGYSKYGTGSITYTFTGTQVELVGYRSYTSYGYGGGTVSIDGGTASTVTWGNTTGPIAGQSIYKSPVLTNGTHTIVITTAGGSGVIDYLEITPANPTRTGYTFGGWNTASDGTGTNYTVGADITPTANVILYAKWTAITYSVTYNANGGTGTAPATQSGAASYEVWAPVFSRAGYTFRGWNTAANGLGTTYATSRAAGEWITPTANVILYAKWTAITYYTVTYNNTTFAGGTGTVPASQSGAVSYTAPNNPGTASGYTFYGWYAPSDSTFYNPGQTFTPSGNETLYAYYNLITYSVTYNANGGSPTPATQSGTTSYLIANAPTRSGYNFSYWYGSNGRAYYPGSYYEFISNVTLTARWTLNTYSVTYNANGGSPTPATQSGTTSYLIANAPTRSGYNFSYWYGSNGRAYYPGSYYEFISNVTLTARWTLITYTVTYNANNGTGTVPAVQTGASSYTVPTNILTRSGYTFGGWNTTVNGSGANYTAGATITPIANITLYAKWTIIPYTVSYNANGGTVSPASETYSGTALTLPTPTRSGYVFYYWATTVSGGISVSDPYTPNSNTTLYAQWTIGYGYTGNYQTFTAPYAGTYKLETWGAQGGNVNYNGGFVAGGVGGYSYGEILLTQGQIAYIYVGAQGISDSNGAGNQLSGGFNGGGYGFNGVSYRGSGGGGATDIRVGGTTLANRVIVAGGGAGGATGPYGTIFPGVGGGSDGGNGYTTSFPFTTNYSGAGGTQTLGGVGGINGGTGKAGSLGLGGNASYYSYGSAGGGGGYFGGGGSGTGMGAGGGSGYIGGVLNGNYATSGNIGNGRAQITFMPTVTYDANGGAGTAPMAQSRDISYTVAANTFTRAGYTFTGWNTTASGSATNYATGATIAPIANVTLYAKWALNTYTISYNANGGTPTPATQSGAASYTTATAPIKSGYTFGNWNTSADGSGLSYPENIPINPIADCTLYAQWVFSYVSPFLSLIGNKIIISK